MMNIKQKILHLFKTGFFHVFGVNFLGKALAFGGSVLLVRLLSKEDYGAFTYAWNLVSIAFLFSGIGMEPGVLQLCSERSGDETFARAAYSYAVRRGSVVDLILAAVLLYIGTFVPLKIEAARPLLQAMCLLPLAHYLYGVSAAYLRSQMRNQHYAILMFCNAATLLVGICLLVYLFRLPGIVASYYLSYLVPFALAVFMLKLRVGSSAALDGESRKNLLRVSLISMCTNSLSQLLYLLDVFILGIVDSQEVILASYRTATIIPNALIFIPTALATYAYPYFAQNRHDGAWCMKHYKLALLALGAVNAMITLVLVCGAPLIIRIFFGADYLDAVPMFRVLSVNYFITGTFRIISGNLLASQRKLRFNLCVAVLSGLVNIVADVILIRRWGSMGAAYAAMLVVILASVLNVMYLIRTFKKQTNRP